MRPSDVLDGCGGGLEVCGDDADARKHRLVDLVNVLRSIRRQAATSDAAQESLLYRTTSCFCCSGPLAWSQRRLRTSCCGSCCCRRPPSGVCCKCEAVVNAKPRPVGFLVQAVFTINALPLRDLSRRPWPPMSVPTCFHTSTIPYGLSLKANITKGPRSSNPHLFAPRLSTAL